jgi:N-acetylmuramoyl-L-alanine amidase
MDPYWYPLRQFDPSSYDYPQTAYFVRSPNHIVPRPPRTILYVVIHITSGPRLDVRGTVVQFLEGVESAHYIVNREGVVIQMVRDAHVANHVGTLRNYPTNPMTVWNSESIGIEHVNPYNPRQRSQHYYPTGLQYEASAQLVRWLCHQYRIPASRNPSPRGPGIKGHNEISENPAHAGCPSGAWDWDHYMGLVSAR